MAMLLRRFMTTHLPQRQAALISALPIALFLLHSVGLGTASRVGFINLFAPFWSVFSLVIPYLWQKYERLPGIVVYPTVLLAFVGAILPETTSDDVGVLLMNQREKDQWSNLSAKLVATAAFLAGNSGGDAIHATLLQSMLGEIITRICAFTQTPWKHTKLLVMFLAAATLAILRAQ